MLAFPIPASLRPRATFSDGTIDPPWTPGFLSEGVSLPSRLQKANDYGEKDEAAIQHSSRFLAAQKGSASSIGSVSRCFQGFHWLVRFFLEWWADAVPLPPPPSPRSSATSLRFRHIEWAECVYLLRLSQHPMMVGKFPSSRHLWSLRLSEQRLLPCSCLREV